MNTESMKPEQRLALKLTLGFEKMGGKLLDICVVIFFIFKIHVVTYTVSINVMC